jgi:hypothetical protein
MNTNDPPYPSVDAGNVGMYRACKGRANSHANSDSRNTSPAYPGIANTMITDMVSFGMIYFFCLLWAMNPPVKSRRVAEINIPLLEDWT